jgi:hypothetical protein
VDAHHHYTIDNDVGVRDEEGKGEGENHKKIITSVQPDDATSLRHPHGC